METYKIENLTFTYPNRITPALIDVNLSLSQGGFITFCGASGCGKTTLLRHLKPSSAPHGAKSGAVLFENTALNALSARDAAAKIGFVTQQAENQIVTDKVWHELAFGLENLGLKTAEIRLRVAETASFFGIQSWFHKSVTELSGGQKQILALASVMAMQPAVLLLDEPTAQLDPIAAGEFLALLGKINRELGVTVLLTEHRLEDALPLSSHVVMMDNGRVIKEGNPYKIGASAGLTTAMRVWAACEKNGGNYPVTVGEGAAWLEDYPFKRVEIIEKTAENLTTAVNLSDIWFKYEKNAPDILKGLSFTANYGEITAVFGGNGTGKTTMLSLIAGLYTPYRGKIYSDAKAFLLPQNPQAIFTAQTVRGDLFGPNEIIKRCRVEHLLDFHPYDLSGGEQQRAALAKVLLLQPKILLLDEPTKGLDAGYKRIFADILRKLADGGAAIIIVSHDLEFCAAYADKCALFFDGGIVAENTPREFFRGNGFYTTNANRMARRVLPDAITANDIIRALGGEIPKPPKTDDMDLKYVDDFKPGEAITETKKTPVSKRAVISAAVLFLTVPLTILCGMYLFDDRKFYIISILIIVQTMLPFALIFEGRKPQARELVMIAVLSALCVAGRAAFFMIPQFKPMIALIIISGVALGAEAGFLIGAAAGFVSNMFFGQGPWTPWQMFALGVIGFFAGVLFRKGNRSPILLSVFGGFSAFFIYGGIMNPAGVLINQPNPTFGMFMFAYVNGIPFDIIHAIATVVFLLILSRPMLDKLDRIKNKYGFKEL